MEFERKTKRGRAAEAAQQAERDAAQVHRDALQTEVEEAQSDYDAIRAGIRARRDEEQREVGGESSSRASTSAPSPVVADVLVHNLDMAQKLINENEGMQAASVPIRLAAIRIEGAKSLRPSFLGQLCKPYLDATLKPTLLNRLIYSHRLTHVLPGQYTSLSSILGLTSSIGSDLTSLDLFDDIIATLRPSEMGVTVEDVDIVLACKEKGNYFIKTSTDVGNGEGNATVQARIRNMFGGAERAEFSATMGTKTRRAFSASLSSPLFASPDHNVTLSAFALDRDLTSYASLIEGARGVRLAFQTRPGGGLTGAGSHEIGFDITHRHLSRLLPAASLSMKKLSGHSIKSSLSHQYTRETRDDAFTATQGSFVKFLQEWAGFGGDAQHYKAQVETQMSRCFGDGFAYSLAAQGGLLQSLNQRTSLFCDRFQLGGPVSVRMFRYNSLGPKDGYDSLGGDVFYSLGGSVFAPVPTKPDWPLKFQTFLNVGQLIQLDQSQPCWSTLNRNMIADDLIKRPSSSIGLGLMYRQGNLRAEVNFGVPLTVRAGDGARKGVQLGIGISFM
ncbi:hypothetical protein CBS101457_003967 [Exobasidium rhododendri]|nr:hypothetical protein CBS101457_003967 [Exobasidium rhododendri]